MARPKAKAPARRYHISGQSVVTIAGRDFYLGKHDSPESIARYAVLICIYQAGGMTLPDDFQVESLDERAAIFLGQAAPSALATQQADQPILISHITASYREHIKGKYKHSKQDRERRERLCEILEEQYANVPAKDFGPLKLAEVRDFLTKNGLRKKSTGKAPSRSYVNRLVQAAISIFNHAVSKEMHAAKYWQGSHKPTTTAQMKRLPTGF